MRRELFIVTPKKCIFWILYACIVFSAAYSLFGISLSTFYLCDVLNLMLLYFEAKYIKEIKNRCAPLLYILIALLLILMVGAGINFVKPLLVFWGIRNLCRYYILFFGVILFYILPSTIWGWKLLHKCRWNGRSRASSGLFLPAGQ